MFVDSHCHLDRVRLDPYGEDFDRFIEATRAGGIEHMLCVAIDLERYPAMRELVAPYEDIWVSVGVHPNDCERREPDVQTLCRLADDPKVVAIGETGLDYFRSRGELGWQQARFRVHIRAAIEVGKPLIVHTREARDDTLRILKEEGAERCGGVLHCFTEDWAMAQAALDMGFYISFSGIVTFKNAQALREVARKLPLERMLIETDSPYLAPVPYRGKPNQPLYVREVAQALADLRDLPVEVLAERTRNNYFSLFSAQS